MLPRLNPSLVQSISGAGKPPKEHLNWSGDLYVTDWFLSSGLISGGPGHRKNSKVQVKNGERYEKKGKKTQKIRRATKGNKSRSTFTCDCQMKSWFNVPSNVFSAAFVSTSISITHSINRESIVVTKIHPILSPEYLRCRETAQRAFEAKWWIIRNRLILELRINFRRIWA